MDTEHGHLTQEEIEENAWIDYMNAREAALQAAVGHFVVANIPTLYLREIVDTKTKGGPENLVVFAAQIALHARGEPWRPEPVLPCGDGGAVAVDEKV
jgi:hypothetical protein